MLFSDFLTTWQLDPTASDYEVGQPPQAGRYTLSYDGRKIIFNIWWLDAQHEPHTLAFEEVPDGRPYPYQANPAVDEVILTPVSPQRLDSESRKAGQTVLYATRELSDDKQSMTVVQSGRLPDGSTFDNRSLYRRAAPTAAASPQADRAAGLLLGLAVADAVGTTVEFSPRGSFPPLTDMVGGGPFHLQPGQWTDDTSMALCLGYSLLARNGFDPADQMDRYTSWWETGYLSSTGRCFDIGNTVAAALRRFGQTGDPYSGSTDPFAAGNGSIMRLAPIPLFYAADEAELLQRAADSSRTTHGAAECLDACRFFASQLRLGLRGRDKETLLRQVPYQPTTPKIQGLAAAAYLHKSEDEIRGSGYVVDSLEAALWCFARTDSFRDAVLMAANLGDDADTTAAVCGQLAGVYYGRGGIPESWAAACWMGAEIETLALNLWQTGAAAVGGAQ